MKNVKKLISVLLCVMVACSVMTVTAAGAATSKKYAKSISISKKDTVTIPADKKTLTKTYKVTVKVKGGASKKFTAKSANASVAAVKVSGNGIKVTAKKAGKARITVTTKAKGIEGKKLSKTLTLTVKKAAEEKYAESISVKSKATITIPGNEETAEKIFAVTVKVKGSTSKAFTAKSSNTEVAEVEVSGSSIKVTAKKQGSAIITVTTKAKTAEGIALSKTLVLTVKKEEPVVPASLNYYSSSIWLFCNPKIDSKLFEDYTSDVIDMIDNPDPKGVYYAEVADKTVADAANQKTRIYSVGAGSTTAEIYEELNGKTRLLGTVEITVESQSLADVIFSVYYAYDEAGFRNIWLKLHLNQKTYNFKEYFNNALYNEKTGAKISPDDYTVTYSSDDEKVAAVDENGVLTGKAAGTCRVTFSFKFSDGSQDEAFSEIKVTDSSIEKVEGYTIDNIRDYIVGIDTPVELKDGTKVPLTNFDNAATTPAFKAVQEAVDKELEMYGSIGRGFSQKSNHSTDIYNSVRDKVLDFFSADPELYTCFYVNTTTDGLNKLASALVEKEDDIVLTTRIEHHANDLSWRERCKVIYAEVDEKGRVIYDDIEKLLKENQVKIVSISAASNVTGYVNDVHRVAKLAHKYGAMIVVDGAQIVAHRKFEMMGDPSDPDDDIDFIAFSAHKMYSPYGGGAVVGLTEILNQHMPEFYGGGTIKVVGDYWQVYKDAPAAYEAGSPNYPGVVGLGKAIDVLSTIGMDKIEAHEKVLNRKIIDGLKKLDNVIIYGDTEDISDKVGVVTFNFSDINTFYISESLSELGGVATRRGAFCAHPYVWRLMGIDDDTAKGFATCTDINTAGMVRVSFGIYNNEEEVNKFLELMPTVMADAKTKDPMELAKPEY